MGRGRNGWRVDGAGGSGLGVLAGTKQRQLLASWMEPAHFLVLLLLLLLLLLPTRGFHSAPSLPPSLSPHSSPSSSSTHSPSPSSSSSSSSSIYVLPRSSSFSFSFSSSPLLSSPLLSSSSSLFE
ncbi:hypothetical protein E2C01_081695 [Portunus trituberculatus]|uniref:Uncharacterized protein n=1 Tax=Portunus trituberculatus TaxID=210409 RepID=A0A5B7J1T7_PORTR|nr:hypothetical protein [Portunus trituberculatus]